MLIGQGVFGLDKPDVQFLADPPVALVAVLLVEDDLHPELVRVHFLCLFEQVQSLALNRLLLALSLLVYFVRPQTVLADERLVPEVTVQPQRPLILVNWLEREQVSSSDLCLHCYLVFLCIVLQDLLRCLYHHHNVVLVLG